MVFDKCEVEALVLDSRDAVAALRGTKLYSVPQAFIVDHIGDLFGLFPDGIVRFVQLNRLLVRAREVHLVLDHAELFL